MTSNSPSSSRSETSRGHGFGTAPVFLASISTILGAIMFLRFGYAVGNLGLLKTLLIIVLGHMVTIPTAMAIAEIATNRRVEGGGEYYIISRSFGRTIGGAIGFPLYLSQVISVAFYMIAFAEAFSPILQRFELHYGVPLDPRLISLPATLILLSIILKRGAAIGVRALWIVSAILLVSLGLFFFGRGMDGGAPFSVPLANRIADPDRFMLVFAICFPAFTGMTAGVGLSGDLKNPRKSIPLGVLSATLLGMAVYIAIAIKLAASAPPEALATDQLIMSSIALWGPIIPIGLAAATLSSAVGSILVAPRTLQALSRDRVLPGVRLNALFARGRGPAREPVAATLVSSLIAIVFVFLGDVNFVAQIISMFFMVTYGALCSVSFLEHFAGNPSYRPSFRSRWYISLLGAVVCFMTMFQMQPLYAVLSILFMLGIYKALGLAHKGERDLAAILEGVMFQLTRRLQISLQQSDLAGRIRDWRPSFVAISRKTLDSVEHFDLLRWISHRHGFGQLIHYMAGDLTPESKTEADAISRKLIVQTEAKRAGIFAKTIVAPSYTTAVFHAAQLPGVSGLPNNGVLFEFSEDHPDELEEAIKGAQLMAPLDFNVCIMRSSGYRFGYRRSIHIWLTPDDLVSAPLQILLAYIIVGHPDWVDAEIRLFACYPAYEVKDQMEKVNEMVTEGRLPIPPAHITPVPYGSESSFEIATAKRSSEADLVILGLTKEEIFASAEQALLAHKDLHDVLFVNANEEIRIS